METPDMLPTVKTEYGPIWVIPLEKTEVLLLLGYSSTPFRIEGESLEGRAVFIQGPGGEWRFNLVKLEGEDGFPVEALVKLGQLAQVIIPKWLRENPALVDKAIRILASESVEGFPLEVSPYPIDRLLREL